MLAKGNWSPGADQKTFITCDAAGQNKLSKILNCKNEVCQDNINRMKNELIGSCVDLELNNHQPIRVSKSKATLHNGKSGRCETLETISKTFHNGYMSKDKLDECPPEIAMKSLNLMAKHSVEPVQG